MWIEKEYKCFPLILCDLLWTYLGASLEQLQVTLEGRDIEKLNVLWERGNDIQAGDVM